VDTIRLDHDPLTGAARGALLEGAATNLLAWSEDISAWGISPAASVIITTDATTAPDGETTADLVVSSADNNAHLLYKVFSGSPNTKYTGSIFAKAAGYNYLDLAFGNSAFGPGDGNFFLATVDLSAGAIVGSPTASEYGVVDFGGGWYRIWITGTSDADGGNYVLTARSHPNSVEGSSFAADGTSGAYSWGADVDVGAAPSSYIRTGASSATRAADVETVSPTDQASSFDWYAKYDDDSEEQIAAAVTGDFEVDPTDLSRPNVKLIWAQEAA
jgi:hypothetical protein